MPQFTLYNFKTLGKLGITRSGYSWGIKNTRRYCFQLSVLSIYFMVSVLLHKCTNENILSKYIQRKFSKVNAAEVALFVPKKLDYEQPADICCLFRHVTINAERRIKKRDELCLHELKRLCRHFECL